MKETLYIKQISDTHEKDKDGILVHKRSIKIADTLKGKEALKIVFSNAIGDLPSPIRALDKKTDIWAEVDVEINLRLASRQRKITEVAKPLVDEIKKGNIKITYEDDENE